MVFNFMNNALPQLDKELLNDYVQCLGKNVVTQMFTLYRQQVTLYLKDIESALLSDNGQLWQQYCHKMKGAAASVGLKSLHARLKNMEKTEENVADKAHQLSKLIAHNKQAMAEFEDWLSSI